MEEFVYGALGFLFCCLGILVLVLTFRLIKLWNE
jgi:hypothetical protein